MASRTRTYQRISQVNDQDIHDYHTNPHEGDEVVDQNDNEQQLNDDEKLLGKNSSVSHFTRSPRAMFWSTKLHAFLWVLIAGSVAYAIDVFHVVFHDPRVKRGWFNIALMCSSINLCITLYLAIYLPYIKRVQIEWSVYCPRMIPTASIVGVIATICFIFALWPLWGLLTPALLFLFFIGTLMTAHFLPPI